MHLRFVRQELCRDPAESKPDWRPIEVVDPLEQFVPEVLGSPNVIHFNLITIQQGTICFARRRTSST